MACFITDLGVTPCNHHVSWTWLSKMLRHVITNLLPRPSSLARVYSIVEKLYTESWWACVDTSPKTFLTGT